MRTLDSLSLWPTLWVPLVLQPRMRVSLSTGNTVVYSLRRVNYVWSDSLHSRVSVNGQDWHAWSWCLINHCRILTSTTTLHVEPDIEVRLLLIQRCLFRSLGTVCSLMIAMYLLHGLWLGPLRISSLFSKFMCPQNWSFHVWQSLKAVWLVLLRSMQRWGQIIDCFLQHRMLIRMLSRSWSNYRRKKYRKSKHDAGIIPGVCC